MSQKQSFNVEFKVLSPADIQAQQDRQVEDVSAILGEPPEAAAILLRRYRWNKERLIESYMDRPEIVLDTAGLGPDLVQTPKTQAVPGFVCEICFDDDGGMQTYAMRCGHRYCVECYQHYLAQKIGQEGEAARIQCPRDGCNRVIDSKTLELLVTPNLKDRYVLRVGDGVGRRTWPWRLIRCRYNTLLTRTYVDDKENMKWCPAPNCEYAVDCVVKKRQLAHIVPTVTCWCGHSFCFGCALNDHRPCPCTLVKKWLKKCEDDSETSNWISANTKECPKCISTIEKNGGCNHMTWYLF